MPVWGLCKKCCYRDLYQTTFVVGQSWGVLTFLKKPCSVFSRMAFRYLQAISVKFF